MKLLILSLSLFSAAADSTTAQISQDPHGTAQPQDVATIPALTPDIWEQLQNQQRDEDPRQLVTRNAEQQAEERRRRIAALKRAGYSKSRPIVSPTPFTSFYAPHWAPNPTCVYWR